VASKFTRFESSYYNTWEILQEKVYKTPITDLDEPTEQLKTEWTMDHVVIAAAIRPLASSVGPDQ